MKNNFLFLLLCAFVGYGLGLVDWSAPSGSLEMFSQSPVKSLNSYDNLACPSEAEYQKLAARVNLEIPEGPSLDVECGSGHRAALAKALHLMNQLRFKLPKSWPKTLQHNLSNSFNFLEERSSKLTLDLSQKDSVAYNRVASKEIYLGGRFFTMDPLTGVAILIHEARHSEPQADSHVACVAGDIPRTQGACDARFSFREEQRIGAYGYGTLFNIALSLYGDGLAESDRQEALVAALVELSSRFNEIPAALARKVDVLAVLTEDQKIKLVHPFLGYTVPVDLQFDDPNEKPERIEFSPRQNGLFIYTSAKRIWSWSAHRGLEKFYPELLTRSVEVMDVARTKIPWQDMTLYFVRTAGNQMHYVEYSPQKNQMVLRPYPLNRGGDKTLPDSPFSRTFLALYDESVFLTEGGGLYLAPHYGNEPVFGEPKEFRSAQGWESGTGGVIYDSLFLIDKRGELHVGGFDLADDQYGATYKAFTLQKSLLNIGQPLAKYAQGLNLQVALDRQGALHAWDYKTLQPHRLYLGEPVRDFVLTQMPDVSRSIGQVYPENEDFIKTCSIEKAIDDPWMRRGIGYDSQGRLVMAGAPGADNPCVRMPQDNLKEARPYL